MSKSELLDDITEQGEEANVIYDFDSIVYLSCYRFKDTEDIELIYADCWMRLKSIEAEIWNTYKIDETIVSLTSKKNFRHGLTSKWKADRKPKPESEMTEKQLEAHREALKLKTLVSQVKALMHKRMASSPKYTVMVDSIQESDDRCLDYAHRGWLVVSIDSDIIKQSPTPVFNQKKWVWTEGNEYQDICRHILLESIAGTHNGAGFGVKGIGLKGAAKLLDNGIDFDTFVNLFETPEDMLMNVRVISCGQVNNGKLKLLDVNDVADMINEINDDGEGVF